PDPTGRRRERARSPPRVVRGAGLGPVVAGGPPPPGGVSDTLVGAPRSRSIAAADLQLRSADELGMACGSQRADPRALAGFGRGGTARCVRGYAGTKTRVATLVRADVNGLADVALEARGDRGRETDAAERRTARNLGAPRTLRSAGKPRRTPEPIPRCTVSAACTDCGLPRSRRGPAARIPCDTCFLR